MTSAQASFPRWLLHLPGPCVHRTPANPVSAPVAGNPHTPRDAQWVGYWLRTWTAKNADWRPVVVTWTPDQCRDFVAAIFPWFLPTYEAYPDEACRRETVKYLFAFTFGGMYVEPTMECLQSVADLRSVGVDVMFGSLDDHLQTAYSLPSDWILSMPRATFWLYVLEFLLYPDMWPEGTFDAAPAHGALDLTGSRVLRLAYLETQKAPPTAWTELRVARLHFAQNATGIADGAWQSVCGQLPDLPASSRAFWGLSPIPSRVGVLGPKALYPLNWQNPAHARFVLGGTAARIYGSSDSELDAEAVDSALAKQTQTMRATYPYAYAVNYW